MGIASKRYGPNRLWGSGGCDSKEQNWRYPVHCGRCSSCGRRNHRHEALAGGNPEVHSTSSRRVPDPRHNLQGADIHSRTWWNLRHNRWPLHVLRTKDRKALGNARCRIRSARFHDPHEPRLAPRNTNQRIVRRICLIDIGVRAGHHPYDNWAPHREVNHRLRGSAPTTICRICC